MDKQTPAEADSIPMRPTFAKALEHAVNAYSKESGSNTPDYILAEYLLACLKAFDGAVQTRAAWYGRMDTPGQDLSARTERLSEEVVRLARERLRGGAQYSAWSKQTTNKICEEIVRVYGNSDSYVGEKSSG